MTNNEEPYIRLTVGEDEELILTRQNAEFYTFAADAVLFNGLRVLNPQDRNHVFYDMSEPEAETRTGGFIMDPEIVSQLGAMMLRGGFPAKLNQNVIPESDENAFIKYTEQRAAAEDIPDYPPDDAA